MSALNREKAHNVLAVPMREQQAAIESVLDMLEECVVDDWDLAAQKNRAIDRAAAAEATLTSITSLLQNNPSLFASDWARRQVVDALKGTHVHAG